MSGAPEAPPKPSAIDAFAVFNMEYGTREDNEDERCFVFHPPSVEEHHRAQDIGLAAGLCNFTRQFAGGVAAHALHCARSRTAFWLCEPDFWMMLRVRTTGSPDAKDGGKAESAQRVRGASGRAAARADAPFRRTQRAQAHDSVLRAVLERAYRHWRVENGSFAAYGSLRSSTRLALADTPLCRWQRGGLWLLAPSSTHAHLHLAPKGAYRHSPGGTVSRLTGMDENSTWRGTEAARKGQQRCGRR